MKRLISTFAALLAASLFAAPAKGPVYEPVAEGYPAWAGITESNYIMGRHLCPSDLRHKFTVVVWVDAEKYKDQIMSITGVTSLNPSTSLWAATGETAVFARDTIFLLVVVGKVDTKEFCKFIRPGKQEDVQKMNAICASWYVYSNVTCSKVDHGGKFPYYCVFGAEPGDALAHGEMNADMGKTISKLKKDSKNMPQSWKPYFGSIEEPQFNKTFVKTLKSGKPLEGLTAACRKGISSKNPDQAKESQILYDALEQTRSDYLFNVISLATVAPTRALYEANIMMKQWPKTKKLMKPKIDAMMAIPDMKTLAAMFDKIKKWEAEDFQCKNAAEAKKIEAELKKMKTTCDGIIAKSSSNIAQSAAAWIGAEAETLAPLMESKVPSK